MPADAEAPPDLLTPGTASAAASASRARASSTPTEGMSGSSRSSAGNFLASSAGSARPAKRSSGATRAMATARSASASNPEPTRSLVDTTACLRPTRTRSPRSSPSERCDSSTAPSRTSTDSDMPRTAMASAASAPARFAAPTRRSARSARAVWSRREVIVRVVNWFRGQSGSMQDVLERQWIQPECR